MTCPSISESILHRSTYTHCDRRAWISFVVNVLTTRENDLLEICKRERELIGASFKQAVVAKHINLFRIFVQRKRLGKSSFHFNTIDSCLTCIIISRPIKSSIIRTTRCAFFAAIFEIEWKTNDRFCPCFSSILRDILTASSIHDDCSHSIHQIQILLGRNQDVLDFLLVHNEWLHSYPEIEKEMIIVQQLKTFDRQTDLIQTVTVLIVTECTSRVEIR